MTSSPNRVSVTIGRSALGSCEPGAAFTNCTSVVLSTAYENRPAH